MLVFIVSPYGGKPENVLLARRFMRMALTIGLIPIVPHVLFDGVLDDHDPAQRKTGMAAGWKLMRRCRWMWVCGDVRTDGMNEDVEVWKLTHKNGYVRNVSLAELVEWEATLCLNA